MPYKTQNPHLGPGGKVETFDESSWPNDRIQLGYVFEKGTKRWQCFKVVDATASANDVLYVKNYASYEATPTIGNGSRNEVAGVTESAVSAANNFHWLRQGGPCLVKSDDVTFARGDRVIADSSNNRVTAQNATLTGALSNAADTAGAILSLQSPYTDDVFVDYFSITTTVKAAGACTADFGYTVTNGTTSSDNLIDGVDLGAATLTDASNFSNPGTNGKFRQVWKAGKWLTGSTATGNVAGMVGTYTLKVSQSAACEVIGIALGAVAATAQGITGAAGKVVVDLQIQPL